MTQLVLRYRPREGSVFSVYKDVKKAFRHRYGYHSDFNSFYGDVMQALSDSSNDQACDTKIVDTYYLDNCQTMEVQTIAAEQVNQFIMRLKRGKAPGLITFKYYHEHLIFGNSEVLCASLASLCTGVLSTA